MQASRLLASQLNSVNFRLHEVAGSMEPDDWLRRAVPGTNLPAFTFWHVVRVIDSTVHLGIRGVPELIESQPWASKPWARPDVGTGYSAAEADELAAQAVPSEVLEYADAVRSIVSQWLRAVTDEELEAPNAMTDRLAEHSAYKRPAARQCLNSGHSSPMSQDIVHATNLGGGACRVSAVTSSTRSSWNAAVQLRSPATIAFQSAGSSSSSGDSNKVATPP